MNQLLEQVIQCPYCGEEMAVLIDSSVAEQDYIEDCQVCCRPIVFNVEINSDEISRLQVRSENE